MALNSMTTTPPFTIRPATVTDLEALTDIWHVGWAGAHAAYVPDALIEQRTRDSFRTRFDDMLGATTAGVVDGQVVGFCCTKPDEIYQMYVGAAARGTGIAGALIAESERRLKAAGTTDAFLDVIVENARAIAFYRKQGWQDGSIETALLDTLSDPFPLELRRMCKTL